MPTQGPGLPAGIVLIENRWVQRHPRATWSLCRGTWSSAVVLSLSMRTSVMVSTVFITFATPLRVRGRIVLFEVGTWVHPWRRQG